MREILFRGKRIENGEWVYGNYVHNGGYPLIINHEVADYDDEYICPEYWWRVDPSTVGQYTGRADVNKKKIFEGDVVQDLSLYFTHKSYFDKGISGENYEKYRRNANMSTIQFVTEDVGSCGCCYPVFTGSGLIAYSVNLDCCEVVGNIHDNPELLKQKRK